MNSKIRLSSKNEKKKKSKVDLVAFKLSKLQLRFSFRNQFDYFIIYDRTTKFSEIIIFLFVF